jgi:integrase
VPEAPCRRFRLQLFIDRYPDLRVGELRPYHVQEWIDSFAHLSSGSKRNHCRAIQRALHWAEEQGIIDRSPLAHFKKPRAGRRDVVITPDEYANILRLVPNEEFRDLIAFAWETGARAAECVAIERRHVDLERGRIVFPRDEEKMRRAPRVIYLSAAALAIVRRRMLRRFNRVFVNRNGRPWTNEAVNCAFCAVQRRMGKEIMLERGIEVTDREIAGLIPKLRSDHVVDGQRVAKSPAMLREEAKRKLTFHKATALASKYCLTAFRHSWCHHALCRGLDALTVSVLMGHADPSMVARVYSHLSHATDYLQEAANRAVS